MPNEVLDDLQRLKTTDPLAVSDDVRAKIDVIIAHCNAHYSSQNFYGHAALNRKILLDPVVAENLTSDVIQALMSNSPPPYAVLKRSTGKGIVDINFKDVLLHCLSEGLLAIKYLPNNEREYDAEKYDAQKNCFEQNTLKILRAIQDAARRPSPYQIPLLPYPSLSYFKKLVGLVDSFKAGKDRSDRLLHMVGYSPNDIRRQVEGGFSSLAEKLSIDDLAFISIDELCDKLLSAEGESVLLDGVVSHLFYDRLHLTAALASNEELSFKDGKYRYRDIFTRLIQKISASPGQYPIAETQIFLRLQLIQLNLLENFPQDVKLYEITSATEFSATSNRFDENNHYQLSAGPLPISIFTQKLKEIALKLLAPNFSDNFNIQTVGNDQFLTIGDEIVNLSEIIKNANFEHLLLYDVRPDSDSIVPLPHHELYQSFMASDSASIKNEVQKSEFIKNAIIQLNQNRVRFHLPVLTNTEIEEIKKQYGKLTLAEVNAIHRYTRNYQFFSNITGFAAINDFLRGFVPRDTTPQKFRECILHAVLLSSALNKLGPIGHNNEKEFIAVRFFEPYGGIDFEALAGTHNVVPLSGFVSAMANLPSDAREEYSKEYKVEMRFITTKGNVVSLLSALPYEEEILSPPTLVQVVDYKKSAGKVIVTVRAITDVGYNPAGSRFFEVHKPKRLNYAPIAALFREISSKNEYLRKTATKLIAIYQVLERQDLLTDRNLAIFKAIIDAINDHKTTKTSPEELSVEIVRHLTGILNVENLDIAYRCYLQSPDIVEFLNQETLQELTDRGLILKTQDAPEPALVDEVISLAEPAESGIQPPTNQNISPTDAVIPDLTASETASTDSEDFTDTSHHTHAAENSDQEEMCDEVYETIPAGLTPSAAAASSRKVVEANPQTFFGSVDATLDMHELFSRYGSNTEILFHAVIEKSNKLIKSAVDVEILFERDRWNQEQRKALLAVSANKFDQLIYFGNHIQLLLKIHGWTEEQRKNLLAVIAQKFDRLINYKEEIVRLFEIQGWTEQQKIDLLKCVEKKLKSNPAILPSIECLKQIALEIKPNENLLRENTIEFIHKHYGYYNEEDKKELEDILEKMNPDISLSALKELFSIFHKGGNDSHSDHELPKKKMSPKIGIDQLVERGFLSGSQLSSLTDHQRYNLDFSNITILVLDGKMTVEQVKKLSGNERYNFTDNVCRFINEGRLSVDQAIALTVDERIKLYSKDTSEVIPSGKQHKS